jgi:SAM-dependent methyltransferase
MITKCLERYLNVMLFDLHKAMMQHKLRKRQAIIHGNWLDIGAGNAPYKAFFASADNYLTTNTKRHYSTDNILRLEPITTFWIEDGSQLPPENDSFDGVASFQVLSVINKPEQFFREVNRVLKMNGSFLLSTDFLYPVWSNEDCHRLTANRLVGMLQENGFQVDGVESFGGFFSMIYMLYARFLKAYPARWKKRCFFSKCTGATSYLLALLSLPLTSFLAFCVFLAEKNTTDYLEDTYNYWLDTKKQ